MKGYLTENQIKYVLYHLNIVYDLNDIDSGLLVFCKDENELANSTGKVIFLLSDKSLKLSEVRTVEELPILFPNDDFNESNAWVKSENGNLIFIHDVLKTCFYLLSGYQETKVRERDQYGRFQYKKSIQHRLAFVQKPIVNYYFKMIVDQITHFKANQNLIKPRAPFGKLGFMLTHDIDYVDYYTFENFLYKIKEIFGLAKSYYSLKKNVIDFFQILWQLLKFNKKDNPSWTFQYMRDIEKKNGFRSVFYFLNKDHKNKDSRYRFSDKRMKVLFQYLLGENCELGIHGTVGSVKNQDNSKQIKTFLEKESGVNVAGIRQHRLLYELPLTAKIHSAAGYDYDTTLSFAEHEGFRNSFCFPFKLYDFEADEMINVWEIPLNAMDVTLFHYRKLSVEGVKRSVEKLLDEIEKFGGVFTLLWHNDFFDEARYPGVNEFYKNIHKIIADRGVENLLGKEIVDRLQKLNN